MCRETVPRKVGNDQIGTRPRNVRDGTSNGVATTFLFRGSPRKGMVLARGPRETPIFSEGVGRGAEGVEERGRHSEASGAKRKCKAVKRVEGGTPEERGSEGSGRG